LPGGRRGPNLRSQKNIARCRSQSGYATLFDIEVLLVEPTIRGIKKHTAKNEPILVCRTRDDSCVFYNCIKASDPLQRNPFSFKAFHQTQLILLVCIQASCFFLNRISQLFVLLPYILSTYCTAGSLACEKLWRNRLNCRNSSIYNAFHGDTQQSCKGGHNGYGLERY